MSYVCTTGLVFVFLSPLAAAAMEAPKAAQEQPAAAVASAIHYQDGRLSARIANKPLKDVLRELSAATGARFVLTNPGGGQTLVSVAVDSQPFPNAVKLILKGFSYAIYSRDGTDLPTVLVLPASGQTAGAPALRAKGESEAEQAAGPAQKAAEQETLDQAIAALSSQGGPSQQALDRLVGNRDPRATQALVQAASEASDSHTRAQATEALWHHAADLEFADETSIGALQQLADDANAEVQKTARQALNDMQQYRQNNPSP